MRVVIDTNVIISSMLSGRGQSRIFMSRVYGGSYEVIVSETIMSEYARVLEYEKFGFDEEDISFVLNWFRSHAFFVEVNEEESVPEMDTKDPSDKPFYLLARATQSLLVTRNLKHYPVEEWRVMIYELL